MLSVTHWSLAGGQEFCAYRSAFTGAQAMMTSFGVVKCRITNVREWDSQTVHVDDDHQPRG